MISDDLAGQSLNMAQKSAEIALEIARLLKSIYDSHSQRRRERTVGRGANGATTENKSTKLHGGEVSLKKMEKSNFQLSMQPNIAAKDMEAIIQKAKEYHIPVSFIGKGAGKETVSAVFRTDDKSIFTQIMQEVMQEKLAAKPNDYLTFQMNNLGEAQTMAEMLRNNDIPADISKDAEGKYQCVYEAKNAEAVKIIKQEFKETHESIKNDFAISNNGNKYTLKDSGMDKAITLSSLPTKEKLIRICKEQFGYSEHKAMEAAHKFENTLSGDRLKYFRTDTRQAELLNNYERNIRLADEKLIVKPYTFTRSNFVSDNVNRYLISDGEKAVELIPDKMKQEEMIEEVKDKLGINDDKIAEAVVDKTQKIEVANKVAELRKKSEVKKQEDIQIERKTDNYFDVSQGNKTARYKLSDKKETVKYMQEYFGISEQKAESVFQKAQRQSPLQNSFHEMQKKATEKSNAAPVKNKKENKGARK